MPGSSSVCWSIADLLFIELVMIKRKGEINNESKRKNAGWITI